MEAREADNVVELLQKGADGILIFVRPCVVLNNCQARQLEIIGWIILRSRHKLPCPILGGPQVKSARFIRILSREDLLPSW